jgi:hypothetical protein
VLTVVTSILDDGPIEGPSALPGITGLGGLLQTLAPHDELVQREFAFPDAAVDTTVRVAPFLRRWFTIHRAATLSKRRETDGHDTREKGVSVV